MTYTYTSSNTFRNHLFAATYGLQLKQFMLGMYVYTGITVVMIALFFYSIISTQLSGTQFLQQVILPLAAVSAVLGLSFTYTYIAIKKIAGNDKLPITLTLTKTHLKESNNLGPWSLQLRDIKKIKHYGPVTRIYSKQTGLKVLFIATPPKKFLNELTAAIAKNK